MSFREAAEKLGFRQKAYQGSFGGSALEAVMADLARFSNAFEADGDISDEWLRRMQGRRDVFFRIFNHLKLSPTELEQVYAHAVRNAAARLQRRQEVNDE